MFNREISFYLIISFFIIFISCNKIDRKTLVARHNVVQTQIDPLNPLSIGNGEFAFTADITGMQTFPNYYKQGMALGTFSQWAWHSFLNPNNYSLNDVVKYYKTGNDSVPYWYQYSPLDSKRQYEATEWLRANPHRLHLGIVGLQITNAAGKPITIDDIENPVQQLNLWNGELTSVFEIEGERVAVKTLCHQSLDLVSFKIESKLIETGQLSVSIRFPYPAREKFNPGYDFSFHDLHSTKIVSETANSTTFSHQIDNDSYFASLNWKGNGNLVLAEDHRYDLIPQKGQSSIEIACLFRSEQKIEILPSFDQTLKNNKVEWAKFWQNGASIDFSGSSDPRANELERRIILSQYLTKIQCSGSLPPQETGLTSNSWYGKFHLEMHWWHAIHFILWNRSQLIEDQLEYYFNIYDKAKATANMQGYEGVRWPKMTDASGVESPSSIGVFLIWQQPHLIYFTQLLHQNSKNKNNLKKYYPLVEATANFMASYAQWDSIDERYILGPPLIPAQERFQPETTINPVFELAYWKWGLQTAQNMRLELGFKQNPIWQHLIDHLSLLPISDSLYLFTENATDSYSNPLYLTDHPIVLAIAGFLPLSNSIDKKVLENTFDKIDEVWQWETCWGWDFPMAAMCATVLGRHQKAIEYLLMETPKNTYLLNGHNYQHSELPLYLPGNGGLLAAVAMMCNQQNENGDNFFSLLPGWKVKFEGFGSDLNAKQ